jgi:peptidoglycan/xylan/chitin deacetylase (PgdA/CDA1 family)
MTDRLACLTLDVEPDAPGDAGIRLFDDPERFAWFRNTLRSFGTPLTAFVVMQHAERHSGALTELAGSVSLELAVHSYSHDRNNTASHDEVRRARDVFVKLWGKPPDGYRAPYGMINGDGLRTLMGEGFIYDSSIFPTLRIDEFGYNNLGYPRTPFIFTDGGRDLVEVPVAALRGCRLIYSLSFVKLFGPAAFRQLMRAFPLPDVVILDLHPYDLYAHCIPHAFKAWKRYAHLRNAVRAPEILVDMIETLRAQRYQFASVGEAARLSVSSESSPRIPLPN